MKHNHRKTNSEAVQGDTSPAGSATPRPEQKLVGTNGDLLLRVIDLVAAGRCEKALSLLNKAKGRDHQILNAIGVCLLRLGRFDDAIPLFRRLVLAPGCTWLLPVPIAYVTNYATALLLGKHPAGCVEILGELHCEDDPTVRALRAAIRRWESNLSFWQRLNWRIGRIEPKNRSLQLDFPPGDFGVACGPSEAPQPAPTPAPGRRAA